MTLARSLGADTERLSGRDRAETILSFARRENFTQVVVGRSPRPRWRRFQPSLAERLARDAQQIDVHMLTGAEAKPPASWLARVLRRPRNRDWLGLSAAAGAVAAATAVGKALTALIPLPNVSMIFLAAVLVVAVQFGVRAALAAAVLSFLADDFFFIPPLYQFTIAEPQEFFSLVVFVIAASLAGWLAGRAKDQERLAQGERARHPGPVRSLAPPLRRQRHRRDSGDRSCLRTEDAEGERRRDADARKRRSRAHRLLAAARRFEPPARAARRGGRSRSAKPAGWRTRHAAQRAFPVPPAGDGAGRHRGLRFRARCAGPRPCPRRSITRWR